MPRWALLVVSIAGAKVALGLAAYLSGQIEPGQVTKVPAWVYGAVASVFAAMGGALVISGRRDRRAQWLGGLFVLIAEPLTPLVSAVPAPPLSAFAALRLEPFAAAFLWRFIGEFPSPLEGRSGSLVRRVAAGLALLAVALTAANLAIPVLGLDGTWLAALQRRLGERTLYWPLVLGSQVTGVPLLIWRARAGEAEHRQVRLFLGGLLLGIAPFTVQVLLEEVFPAYKAFVRQPAIDPWVGVVMFGALLIVPFVTAYAVVFDRLLETRLVLRAALQYGLARSVVAGLTLVPFLALAAFIISHWGAPPRVLLSGPRPWLLGAGVLAGVVTLRKRNEWLHAIDRKYFREPYDGHEIVKRFIGDTRMATPESLAQLVRTEISKALHTDVDVFIADEAGVVLRDATGKRPPLPLESTLVRIVATDVTAMDVDWRNPASPLGRLPALERKWLTAGDVRLLVPIFRDHALSGLLALSEKQSGLAYSDLDRRLLSTVADAAGLALENSRLRSTPHGATEAPGKECTSCSRINPSGVSACTCGGTVVEARAPKVLRGIYQLEDRIGAGGMGIVYRATDINLRRDVAVKTLPRVTESHIARLRQEARAMAAVTHPNLATVYGIETWRGVPFLIEEYLAGGTLATRLEAGPIPAAQVLAMGGALASALEQLHAGGILHCDIKPSNIGFTTPGVVKLLDFGLARALYDRSGSTTMTMIGGAAPPPGLSSVSGAVRGTPAYLSPEVTLGARPSPALDVWALSVALWEAIIGRRLFTGGDVADVFARIRAAERPDLARFVPSAPAPIVDAFNSLLDLDPARRPPHAAALGSLLDDLRRVPGLG